MIKNAIAAAAAATLLVGCHTITEELPTQPSDPKGTVLKIPIPAIPGATPTPTPTPKPTPTPGPTPTPDPSPTPTPTAGTCGAPLPVLNKMNVKIHLQGPAHWTLDSTPLVHNRAYCAQIGFTDGRTDCPVRVEGAPDRSACEEYAVGHADDTGRQGPTWYRDAGDGKGKQLCDNDKCTNYPTNQYLLWVMSAGTYSACTESGICGSVYANP